MMMIMMIVMISKKKKKKNSVLLNPMKNRQENIKKRTRTISDKGGLRLFSEGE
jgi:hypothetical protein